ncbi:MAG: DUF2953 domain-containing protein [Oscillospiraceae bacterium]|nr:DUF2953 domain-containing protein [Oscillospiraceae bacterium]
MWILAIILAVIFLILALRIRLVVRYDHAGAAIRVWAGPVRIQVYPRPDKGPEDRKKQADKPKKEPKEPHEKGGMAEKLKAGLFVIGPIFGQVRRRLVISEITLHYTACTDDAAKTAMVYGGASAAVSQMLPLIRHHFRVKKQDVKIRADFSGGGDTVFVRVKLSVSVWGAVRLGIFTLKKLREAGLIQKGAKHERETRGRAEHTREKRQTSHQ